MAAAHHSVSPPAGRPIIGQSRDVVVSTLAGVLVHHGAALPGVEPAGALLDPPRAAIIVDPPRGPGPA